MNNYKLSLILPILLVFAITFATAETVYAELNAPTNLQFTCTVSDQIPVSTTTFNISLYSPAGSRLLNNVATTSQGQGAFNYTYTFTTIGTHTLNSFCYSANYSSSAVDFVEVTPTGSENTIWKTVLQLFSSLSALFLSGLFLFFFKQDTGDKKEKGASKFLFAGLSMAFFLAHLILTNLILQQTWGENFITVAYSKMMYLVFVLISVFFLITVIKTTLLAVSLFKQSRGLQ